MDNTERFYVVLAMQVLLITCLGWCSVGALAAPTKIVTGNEGTDLEGATPVKSGPIVSTRGAATEWLKHLNVPGIESLGSLLPEVENSELYLAKQDVQATLPEEQGAHHQNLSGFVYARTLAQPHAATRFFPIAEKLDRDQLVALHIHEALHRALPPLVRTEEAIVVKITLAITSPGATHDGVRATVAETIPQEALRATSGMQTTWVYEMEHYKKPSSIGYKLRQFQAPNRPTQFRVDRLHAIHSDLYPFGGINAPFGMGLEASMFNGSQGTHVGPLGISAKLRVWSYRGFDVGIWGIAALNTLSAEELNNSPYGRDVYTIGLSARKDLRAFYIENHLSLGFGGQAKEKIGLIEYKHEYGKVINARIRVGLKLWRFDLGGFGEMHLADYMRVSGGAFQFDSGRYRIVSMGPETTYVTEYISVSFFGRFIAGTTKDANFDYLGNLMGPGVSQGEIGASVGVFF